MKKEKKRMVLHSEKVKNREKKIKVFKIGLMGIGLFLMTVYLLLRILYASGNFTVLLDSQFAEETGLVMYEKSSEKKLRQILKAESLEFMDNISEDWIPKDLNVGAEGSHNGENYIAYSFYIENQGSETIHYWYTIVVDDVIKNVDKAIRVKIYRNEEQKVYAKLAASGNPEGDTTPFYSEKNIMMEQREDFKSGEIDKFTIVIWIEGDDPDCIDELIGGEMKMHMEITEEHINEK